MKFETFFFYLISGAIILSLVLKILASPWFWAIAVPVGVPASLYWFWLKSKH